MLPSRSYIPYPWLPIFKGVYQPFLMLLLPGVVLLAACWIIFKIKYRHRHKCGEEIPGDKSYPIIGNALPYLKGKSVTDIITIFIEEGKKFQDSGINRIWIGNILVVGVSDPKYIEVISNSPHAAQKGPLYSVALGAYPTGVFTTSDPIKWRELRKPLTKSLTKRNLENQYHNIFLSENKKFINHLNKNIGKEIEVLKELRNLSFDIFSGTHLGVKTDEVEEQRFNFLENSLQYIEKAVTVGIKEFFFQFLSVLKISMESELKEKIEALNKFMLWVFEERTAQISEGKGSEMYYPDFLLRRKTELHMSTEDISRELVDIVFAGSDTSAVLGSSTLLFLAMFPEIQEEAYREQLTIFGENSHMDPTPNDISSMVYLTRIIKESLRHCSPSLVIKHVEEDIVLDKYTIPKGSVAIVLIELLCQDIKYWEKPYNFYPDHFLPECEAERPTYAFIPFGCGPRKCPGIQYGMTSVKLMLSYVLRNFRLSTSLKYEDLITEQKLMREFQSYNVIFEKRSLQQES